MRRVILDFGNHPELSEQLTQNIETGRWGVGTIQFQDRNQYEMALLPAGWSAGDRFEIDSVLWYQPEKKPSGKYAVVLRDEDGRYKGSADEEFVHWIED